MFKLALLTALVASGASALQMVTPAALVQCQPVLLSWNNGTAPYYPAVLPGNEPSAAALVTFAETDATSLTWVVNVAAGTSVSLQVTDGTGATQWASVLTVQEGSSDSCLNSTTSASAGGSAASATGGSSADSTAATSAAASGASAASEAATASATKSAAASTSPTSGAGAVRVAGSLVAAGVIAALAL